jgi:hypothetical protein
LADRAREGSRRARFVVDKDVAPMRTHHEIVLMVAGALFCLFGGWRLVRAGERLGARFGRRFASPRWMAIGIVTFVALLLAALVGTRDGIHNPGTHDEWGYLLQADTFVHGRMTNPVHPFWRHFESMHILVQPSYQAKYPPGQGVALAVGQWLTGEPIVGVWLSAALASGACCWMLQSWVPLRWAFLGGLLAACKLATGGWGQSYWGGAVAAFGGALLFGGLKRFVDQPRASAGFAMALGWGVLANSRPFEGLVGSFPLALLLLHEWRSGRIGLSTAAARLGVPMLVVVTPLALVMASYNEAVTGAWWKLPYIEHDKQYASVPTFLSQAPKPEPAYRHDALRAYWIGWERMRWEQKNDLFGFNTSYLTKIWLFFRFYIGATLAVPWGMLVFVPRGRWLMFALGTVGLSLLVMSQTIYLHAHYLAGLYALTLYIGVTGVRMLRVANRRRMLPGRDLATCCAAVCLLGGVFGYVGSFFSPFEKLTPRSKLVANIEATRPGEHLLFVDYLPNHSPHDEWVYNRADIDHARYVWARSVSPESDAALAARYPNRTVWRVVKGDEEISATPVREPLVRTADSARAGGGYRY